ncbi:hypothetical protein AM500_16025 [Bacillus sp. FJAT-18017]|uniref:UPF0223 family protein n=1 Tax=Bacillus sp. FJAT-18017 TaxID=1705566 RepID=UPI0006AF4D25|nr:UPF0223 family protein [Bacillus sp. FJAT-18017]ALC91136.1 hypothetical protein AM500_16025 [Bacillus sp. FJAT-18017]
MDYQYPIDYTWTTDETIQVIQFFQVIEEAYEKGVNRDKLMHAYRSFKDVVPSKAEEKKLFGEFEQMSGYSPYRTVTKAKEESSGETIRMKRK